MDQTDYINRLCWDSKLGQYRGCRSIGRINRYGKWYYITITKTAGALNTTTKVYVNGIDTALSSPNTSTPNITNAKIEIGSITSVSYYFKGLIKEVSVYNEVKNASWVWNEYLKSNPETDLLFATQNGEKDLSIYKRTITNT